MNALTWLLLVGAGALPDAQHVGLLVRPEAGVDPAAAARAETAARQALQDVLGSQMLQPPEPFPDAEAQRKDGEQKMATAREKAGMLETAEAMEAAEAGVLALYKGAVTPAGVRMLADAHTLAMITNLFNNRKPQAEEHARRAYILNPNVTIDTTLAGTDEEQFFKKTTRQVASLPHGTLELVTVPPGAQVFVDGAPAGPSPVTKKDLLPGPHLVQLVMPWREAVFLEVVVPPGGTSRSESSLKDLPAMVTVRSGVQKDALGDTAGEWRAAATTLGADHSVVLVLSPGKDGFVNAAAHLYANKDGARRRRVEKALATASLEQDATALMKDVLNVAEGAGTPGKARMVDAPAKGTATAAADEPSGGGGGPGILGILPWILLVGAVPVTLLLGVALGAAVGVGISAWYWQGILNTQVGQANTNARRRESARQTTVLGF
jgi:hypothetical protein